MKKEQRCLRNTARKKKKHQFKKIYFPDPHLDLIVLEPTNSYNQNCTDREGKTKMDLGFKLFSL